MSENIIIPSNIPIQVETYVAAYIDETTGVVQNIIIADLTCSTDNKIKAIPYLIASDGSKWQAPVQIENTKWNSDNNVFVDSNGNNVVINYYSTLNESDIVVNNTGTQYITIIYGNVETQNGIVSYDLTNYDDKNYHNIRNFYNNVNVNVNNITIINGNITLQNITVITSNSSTNGDIVVNNIVIEGIENSY